jgi:hypothetical protein
LKNLPINQDVNEEWSKMQTAINEAASDTIQKEERKPRNEWWDEDYRNIIQEKNEARKKALQTKTRASKKKT